MKSFLKKKNSLVFLQWGGKINLKKNKHKVTNNYRRAEIIPELGSVE
jgi:hypothetical protein